MERTDKLISAALGITRSEAKKKIRNGEVFIGSHRVVKPEEKTDGVGLTLNGREVNYTEHIYIMLNKPQGVVSASEDESQKTVIDLVPKELFRKGLFPAGRLDKDTVGFVLITDDGDFAHNILSPKKHIEKTYEVRVDGRVDEELIEKFRQGVVLYDGTECLCAQLRILEDGREPLLEVKIKEGKYHQIKRMFLVNGLHVTYLKRTAIGSLKLDESLEEGMCRRISQNELYENSLIPIPKI